MNKRRIHSSIDSLPADLKRSLELMLVDNIWPDDFQKKGKPRYQDAEAYCRLKGCPVSRSAIGRYGKQMQGIAMMKESGLIARSVMAGLVEENTSQTQKAVAELLTAQVIELSVTKKLKPKEIKELSQSVRDCASISIKAEQFRQGQLSEKAKKAEKAITEIAAKKKIDPETLKLIKEQIYGIAG